jgi:hypothetical protein
VPGELAARPRSDCGEDGEDAGGRCGEVVALAAAEGDRRARGDDEPGLARGAGDRRARNDGNPIFFPAAPEGLSAGWQTRGAAVGLVRRGALQRGPTCDPPREVVEQDVVGPNLLHAVEGLPGLRRRHADLEQRARTDDLLLSNGAVGESVVVRRVNLVKLVQNAGERAQVGEKRAEAAGFDQSGAFRVDGAESAEHRRAVRESRPDGRNSSIHLGQRQHTVACAPRDGETQLQQHSPKGEKKLTVEIELGEERGLLFLSRHLHGLQAPRYVQLDCSCRLCLRWLRRRRARPLHCKANAAAGRCSESQRDGHGRGKFASVNLDLTETAPTRWTKNGKRCSGSL